MNMLIWKKLKIKVPRVSFLPIQWSEPAPQMVRQFPELAEEEQDHLWPGAPPATPPLRQGRVFQSG